MNAALRIGALALVLAACNTGPSSDRAAQPVATPPAPAASVGALRLGAAIEASAPRAALSDVAKAPASFAGKTFATTGTVTAVCQHMGCWMELRDDAGEAHVKMAGHAFFVPKTASGRKATVLAKLVKADDQDACEGEGHAGGPGEKRGCRAEAEAQLGRPLAKLQLVAEGVELR